VTHRPRAAVSVGLALLTFLFSCRAVAAQAEFVVSLLETLRAQGINVIYSSDLVPADLRAPSLPDNLTAFDRAEQALAAHGLMLRPIGPGRYAVTQASERATPPSPPPPPVQASAPPPPAQVETQEVSVYASRYDLRTDDIAESQLLTQTQIEEVPGSQDDALRAARIIPGVASNLSTRPYIRGSFVDDVLVQFDGVPLADPFHLKNFQSLVSAFDPAAVKRIEVYSGGFPVSYGTRSGGVIDVEPRSLSAGYEHAFGASLLAYDAATTGRAEVLPVDWLATGRHSVSDVVLRPVNGREGDPVFMDTLGRVRWRNDDGSAWTLGWLLLEDDIDLSTEAMDERTRAHYRDEYLWIARDEVFSDTLKARTVISSSWGERARGGNLDEPGIGIESLDEARHASSIDLRSLWTWRMDDRTTWTYGIEASHSRADLRYDRSGSFAPAIAESFDRPVDNSLVARAEPEVSSYAAFVSARHRWAPVEIELGVRLDGQHYGDTQLRQQFSPRLNLRYDFAPAWRLYGSWGRFTQAQRVDEWRLEDPQVMPDPSAIAIHSIIGLQYQPSDDFHVSLELYRKRWTEVRPYYENLLDSLSLVPDLSPDRIRVAPMASEASGAELTVRRSLPLSFEVWGGFSASLVSDDFASMSDVRRSWDQPRALNLGVGWSNSGWNASGVFGWHRGWPRTDIRTSVLEPGMLILGRRNADRWGDYFSADLSASRTAAFAGGELSTWVEVTNATDRHNACCAHLLGPAPGSTTPGAEANSWLPRMINVGFTWRFRKTP
jgi:hypothetical protein